MIPVSLRLKGVYSYQEEQFIDFDKLTEAHVFGIFGSVGSGKSTILEAIGFSLYGETERLSKNDNRNYNMMNLKSKLLEIEFVFKAGKNNAEKYKATVLGKRNGKNFSEIYNLKRSLYIRKDNEWQPLKSANAEKVLGVSYENFRRTIIIPQGKFQEFLTLTDDDRSQMLKELFSLERYDLQRKTSVIKKRTELEKSDISARLQELGDISDESLAEIDKNVVAMERAYEKTKKEMDIFRDVLNGLERIVDLTGEAEKLKKELVDLKEEDDALLCDMVELKKELTLAEIDYGRLPDFKKEADDLRRLNRIRSLEQEISVLDSRLKKGDSILDEKQKEIAELINEQSRLKKFVAKKEEKQVNIEELMLVQEWFSVKDKIQNELNNHELQKKKIKKDLDVYATKEIELKDSLNSAIKDRSARTVNFVDEILKREAELSDKLNSARKACDDKIKEQGLKEYAAMLKDNAPCPLCGSLEHPRVLKTEEVNNELQNLSDQRDEYEFLLKKLSVAKIEMKTIRSEVNRLEKDFAQREECAAEINKKLLQHNKLFKWKIYDPDNYECVEQARKTHKECSAEISQLRVSIEDAESKISKARKDSEKYKVTIESLREEISSKQGALTSLEGELSSEVRKKEIGDIDKTVLLIEEKIAKINSVYENKKNALDVAERRNILLSERLSQRGNFLQDTEKKLTLCKKEISRKVKTFSFIELNDVIDYNKVLHDELLAKFKEKINEADFLKENLGKAKFEKERLMQNAQKVNVLTKALEKCNGKLGNLSVLLKLFQGSGFVNYVSTIYLRMLCKAANKRFHELTRQSLSLELTDKNAFQVRDNLNGGQTRSIKTLSGGETFQAALSLAIALSDSIQENAHDGKRFFFLDEGFGSQDIESLQKVFCTLRELRKENRIVGVISHVEDLQQEISIYLKLVNDKERGSLVECSWGV